MPKKDMIPDTSCESWGRKIMVDSNQPSGGCPLKRQSRVGAQRKHPEGCEMQALCSEYTPSHQHGSGNHPVCKGTWSCKGPCHPLAC